MIPSLPLNMVPKRKPPMFDNDNAVFQFHYRFTFVLLMSFAVTITSKQFFGDPIKCVGENFNFKDAINNFCWMKGAYTIRNPQYMLGTATKGEGDIVVHHQYYTWMCMVMLLQALLFAMPHYLWKALEGKRIERMSKELTTNFINPDDYTGAQRQDVIAFFVEKNDNVAYTIKFYVCELLNFLNVVGQTILLDVFMKMSLLHEGPSVMSFYLQDQSKPTMLNPIEMIFPKMTICKYSQYGPGGSERDYDLLCVISLNILYEKMYISVYIWFIALSFLSAAIIIYRIMTVFSTSIRFQSVATHLQSVPKYKLRVIMKKLTYGDWFILAQLGRNIPSRTFKNLINGIYKDFKLQEEQKSEIKGLDYEDDGGACVV